MNILRQQASDLEPAAIYLRKSREDQEAEARGEGETLVKHKKAMFNLAKERNISISNVYEEIVSGESILHRPEMLRLLKDIAAGLYNSVLVMDVDRLGRGNMQDQGLILETFKQSGTKIVTPRKTYDLNDEFDEEYSEFEAFMARKELKLITRRLQGGRIRSVEFEKNYIGTRPPYGYKILKTATERLLVPHPEQAPAVKLIFDLYINPDPEARMGSGKIAQELNRLGFKTYTGKQWEPSTVLFIIKNAVYAGRLQWKKTEAKKSKTPGKRRDVRTRPKSEWIDVEGKHEPLVSMETYLKAQSMLQERYHVPYHLQSGIVNPLASLIRCEFCGSKMVLRPYQKQKPHLICYSQNCPNKSSRFEYVEQKLIRGLGEWLVSYRAEWQEDTDEKESSDMIELRKEAIQSLLRELHELQKQKEKLHDLLERGIYDEKTYLERANNLTERISSLQFNIRESETSLEVEIQRETAKQDIIPHVEKVLDLYHHLDDPAQKNNLLKSILDHATYRKEKWQKDDDFLLILYPRLPK
jgi:DNA invertase Pin-like site-specific DNA recombinase